MRTHVCKCGFVLDRDWNAAINILKLALSTVGHTGTWMDAERSRSIDPNASGDSTSTRVGAILLGQVGSMNEESPRMRARECQ
jgi:putative transposase